MNKQPHRLLDHQKLLRRSSEMHVCGSVDSLRSRPYSRPGAAKSIANHVRATPKLGLMKAEKNCSKDGYAAREKTCRSGGASTF